MQRINISLCNIKNEQGRIEAAARSADGDATRKYLADERSKKSPWKERALRLEESINQCRGIGKRDAGETFVCADGGRALEIANMHSAGNWRIAGFGVAVSATRDKGGKFRVKS